jgi:hypothetical protein
VAAGVTDRCRAVVRNGRDRRARVQGARACSIARRRAEDRTRRLRRCDRGSSGRDRLPAGDVAKKRQRPDANVLPYVRAHVRAIDKHAPPLARELIRVRKALEWKFWSTSGLNRFREDDADVPSALTVAEVAAVNDAIQALETEPYVEAIYNAQTILVDAGWTNAKQLLDLGTGFDVPPAWTLAKLKGFAKQLAFLAVQRERQTLTQALEIAVHNGDGARELAAAIEQAFRDGYHVFDDAGVLTRRMPTKAWSMMVARTEMARAQSLGTTALYVAAGIAKVEWNATRGIACCDECVEADGIVLPIGQDFPGVDTDQPPAHPNCVCNLIAADPDVTAPSGTDEQKDRAARGGYSADEYATVFGHVHPIDKE